MELEGASAAAARPADRRAMRPVGWAVPTNRGAIWSSSVGTAHPTRITARLLPVRQLALCELEVGVDHHVRQFAEGDTRLPVQLRTGFRGVAAEGVDLGRAVKLGVDSHIVFPVEVEPAEDFVEKLADR